jgi:hypothetical protein
LAPYFVYVNEQKQIVDLLKELTIKSFYAYSYRYNGGVALTTYFVKIINDCGLSADISAYISNKAMNINI